MAVDPISQSHYYQSTPWHPTPPWRYAICNCACSVCMAGSCCLNSSGGATTVTTSGPAVSLHEHRWQAVAFLEDVRSVIQSCECGEARRVEVP